MEMEWSGRSNVSSAGLLSAMRQGCRHKSCAPQLCSLFVFEAAAFTAFSITQLFPACLLISSSSLYISHRSGLVATLSFNYSHAPIEPHLSRLTKKSLTILISVCKFHAI